MIKFTELRVHNGHLLITAEVREIEHYYDNVYIDSIKIDTQDTFVSTGPSSNLIYEYTTAGNVKEVTLDLSAVTLGLTEDQMLRTMFFVYAIAKGAPHPSTPCGFDNVTSTGVTFALCPIYNETMQYVKEVENTCELPKGLINMILQLKAIQYSIDSGHYTQAIKYYNKFYKTFDASVVTPCGCHG